MRLRAFALAGLLALASCGRALTGAEAELASALFGPTLDPAPVRLVSNGLVGATWRTYPVRPRLSCRERIAPPRPGAVFTARPGAIALWQRVQFRPDVYRPDYAARHEGHRNLAAAMFLAHELTHVWQWQNRRATGYTPWRAAREHLGAEDPYLFGEANGRGFLDYGYEQQAGMVEEYLCCRTLDPQGARTRRLDALLRGHLPLAPLPDGPETVWLPRGGEDPRGICS